MLEQLMAFFSQSGFMPHNHCYLSKPSLVWTMFATDMLIGIAYVGISITLWALIKKIKIPFNFVVVCFGVFILACGLTHFMDVWTLWNPDYWTSAAIKAVTAIASIGTGIYLYQLRQPILTVAEAAKLSEQRRIDLETLTKDLEVRIAERTHAHRESEEQLRVSERQLRTLADSIPQLAWMAHPNGEIFWYNRRWYEYTGTTLSQMEGWGWQSVHDPQKLPSILEEWKKALQTGEPFEMEFPIRAAADGQYHWFLNRAEPLKDSNGKVLRWFGTNTYVDDQKRKEKNLERAVQSRDEFLSIASHELKTPLTSLKLQTQMRQLWVKKGTPGAFSPEKLDTMFKSDGRQIDRLTRLIDDMLDVSRVSTGQLSIHRSSFDLCELVKEAIEHLKTEMDAANCEITITPCKPVVGNWDRDRIEQVVMNLLTNAIKYGAAKPVNVTMSTTGENSVRLAVCDQGIGIAPENIDRIFQRFERAISANEISGLGLGLFIVRHIVEKHGGRIWVESELGKGSTFFVELPLKSEERGMPRGE